MSAEGPTMQAALDWVRVNHDGAANYLVAHGLTSDELTSLRQSLVESP